MTAPEPPAVPPSAANPPTLNDAYAWLRRCTLPEAEAHDSAALRVVLAAIEHQAADAVRRVPDTGPPPLDFDVLVRSIVDSRYMWISMENAVDMAVTTARLLVDAGAVRIVADGQPIEVHDSLSAMRRLVHSRGITADERDHDVAVSRPAPPLEGRERDRLREVLDAAGLPRDRGWDDVLLALRSMGARAVPDTGQDRKPCVTVRNTQETTEEWRARQHRENPCACGGAFWVGSHSPNGCVGMVEEPSPAPDVAALTDAEARTRAAAAMQRVAAVFAVDNPDMAQQARLWATGFDRGDWFRWLEAAHALLGTDTPDAGQ